MLMEELGLTHLTTQQRCLLAEELLESVEASEETLPPIVAGQYLTQAKLDELERRIAEHDKNPEGSMDVFEFMALMKKKHNL